ncbi:hypothetical protein Bca4012_035463 [Brassica carinata]|uniref:RING-CH-type domain-containing protein n=1 Tax=Brassica carinata TaxID=52824 RepID=A0A8X7WCS1_BRACI|nr:hypothetical protein Bca52824_009233 [Brassica carinata]
MTEIDLEQGAAYGYHRRSFGGSDVSVYYSDGEDMTSCYSYFYSTTGGGPYEYEGGESRKVSSVMDDNDYDEDDDDATLPPEKDCRICHLGVVETSGGGAMELGCSCKEDLAIAHRQCAETWFKIKGDKICEICQSVAKNVGGGANEMVTSTVDERELRNGGVGEETVTVGATAGIENRWQPQRVVNIVLACMVFGFVISWLFHFHVSSSS